VVVRWSVVFMGEGGKGGGGGGGVHCIMPYNTHSHPDEN